MKQYTNYLLLVVLLFLISGCGLLNKSKKIDASQLHPYFNVTYSKKVEEIYKQKNGVMISFKDRTLYSRSKIDEGEYKGAYYYSLNNDDFSITYNDKGFIDYRNDEISIWYQETGTEKGYSIRKDGSFAIYTYENGLFIIDTGENYQEEYKKGNLNKKSDKEVLTKFLEDNDMPSDISDYDELVTFARQEVLSIYEAYKKTKSSSK